MSLDDFGQNSDPKAKLIMRVYPVSNVFFVLMILPFGYMLSLTVSYLFQPSAQSESRVFLLVSVALLAAIVVLLAAIYFNSRVKWRTAEAKILNHDTRIRDTRYGPVTTYYILFQFSTALDEPEVREFTLGAQVNLDTYNRLSDGKTVGLKYAVHNPKMAVLDGESFSLIQLRLG